MIRETATDLTEEQLKALLEAGDIIADYEAAVAQTAAMTEKYEHPERAIDRGMDFWQCSSCFHRTREGHAYCYRCGKALLWDKKSRSRRKEGRKNDGDRNDKGRMVIRGQAQIRR